MRILVRTSRSAIWSRRLALLAAGLLLVSTALHSAGQIESSVFELVLVAGTAVAAAAFLFGLAAYGLLWFSGDRGWGPASVGLFLGLVCLAPAGLSGALVLLYPSTADVSTDFEDPPELVRANPNHTEIDPESILATFPNLITRIYQIPPETLLQLARDLVRTNGWSEIDARMPSAANNTATVNSLRWSFFGWQNEIVFRVAVSPIGSRIDLRAASMEPVYHDLGDNGRAIEAFLLALDDRVSTYIQDNLAMTDDEPFQSPDSEASEGGEADAQ